MSWENDSEKRIRGRRLLKVENLKRDFDGCIMVVVVLPMSCWGWSNLLVMRRSLFVREIVTT